MYRKTVSLLIVLACLGWAVVELATGGVVWAFLFGAIGLYSAYGFFVTFNPRPPEGK